jgi:hypothetical protein
MANEPKVTVRREQTSLGIAHGIYVNGVLMGTALSRDVAEESVPRMLAIYERMKKRDRN